MQQLHPHPSRSRLTRRIATYRPSPTAPAAVTGAASANCHRGGGVARRHHRLRVGSALLIALAASAAGDAAAAGAAVHYTIPYTLQLRVMDHENIGRNVFYPSNGPETIRGVLRLQSGVREIATVMVKRCAGGEVRGEVMLQARLRDGVPLVWLGNDMFEGTSCGTNDYEGSSDDWEWPYSPASRNPRGAPPDLFLGTLVRHSDCVRAQVDYQAYRSNSYMTYAPPSPGPRRSFPGC